MKFRIYRYNPDNDKKPFMQDFELADIEPGMMLLQALLKIKDTLDESLSFRRSCGEGVCGSDGMNINGINGLACITPLAGLKQPAALPDRAVGLLDHVLGVRLPTARESEGEAVERRGVLTVECSECTLVTSDHPTDEVHLRRPVDAGAGWPGHLPGAPPPDGGAIVNLSLYFPGPWSLTLSP